jgi:hypothetical protein
MKNIKHLIIITLLLAFLPTISHAQCDINTISTDPNNYNNEYDPTNAKQWDWMQPTYNLYIQTNQSPIVMNSPFYDVNQRPNIDHLNDVSKPDNTPYLDYLPEDGWELLYKNFGTFTQGQPTPHFLLYNKYSGIIRAFVLVANAPSTVQGATVSLQFFESGSTYYETALLNHFGDITKTSEDFNIDASKHVPNEYLNPPLFTVSDNWMFAEFTTVYDPCTCVLPAGKPTELRLTVDLFNQADVELESFGAFQETIVSGGIVNTNTSFLSTLMNIFDGGIQLYKDGTQGYKNGTEAANDITAFYNNHHDKMGLIFQGLFNSGDQILHSLFGAIANIIPGGGAIYGLTKSVISLVKKHNATANQNNRVQPTIKIQKLKFKTTGTLTTTIPVTDAKIALPGSPHSFTIADNAKKPVYNNVLGVFGLLNKPVVEYVEYKPYKIESNVQYTIPQYGNQFCDHNAVMSFKPISEFKLKDHIQYVVNPQSNLTIKDIKFCYVMHTKFLGQIPEIGPRNLLVPYENRISEMGYIVELLDGPENFVNAQISTPYMNSKCFENMTFKAFQNQTAPFLPEIFIRVKVILEPTTPSPGSNVEEILLIYSYPVTVQTANDYNNPNNRYFVDGSICSGFDPMAAPYFYNQWTTTSITSSPFVGSISNIPMIKTIENQTLGTNTSATSTIIIKDNSILQNSTYFEVMAGEEIRILSTTNPIRIANDCRLGIGYDPCSSLPDAPPGDDYINTFCTTTYLNNFNNSNRMMSSQPDMSQSSGEQILSDRNRTDDIGVLPNPNNGEFAVYIRSSVSINANMYMTDLTGKIVHTQFISIQEGITNIPVVKPELSAGTYFIRVDGIDETVKVIITK